MRRTGALARRGPARCGRNKSGRRAVIGTVRHTNRRQAGWIGTKGQARPRDGDNAIDSTGDERHEVKGSDRCEAELDSTCSACFSRCELSKVAWCGRGYCGREVCAAPDNCGSIGSGSRPEVLSDEGGDGTLQHGHRRIGEAKNPGPEGESAAQPVGLPWGSARPQQGLQYPRPHRPGFRDIWTPGFDGFDGRKENEAQEKEGTDGCEAFQLIVETVNTTSWGPLRKRLRATRAQVVLAQETKIAECKRAEASTWAINNGWKMIAAPAVSGKRGGVSAGVAIFTRVELGVRFPPHGAHILEPGRAVAAVVEAPACRPTLMISVYLRTGTGLGDDNLRTLEKVRSCLQRHEDMQCLIGGDMNTTPEAMCSAGCAAAMGTRIIAPMTRRGTCRTIFGARVYDYFMTTSALANCIDNVSTVEATNVRTHTPVQLVFQPRQTSLKKLTLRLPEPLARERVYGPLPPPPPWRHVLALAEEAANKARGASLDEALELLDRAYGAFADMAERELASATGTHIQRPGQRSEGPRFVWRSVLPERKPEKGEPTCAALTWLESIVRETGLACLGKGHMTPRLDGIDDVPQQPAEIGDGGAHEDGGDEGHGLDGEPGLDEDTGGSEGNEEMIDNLMYAVIADFPAEVSEPEALRLHSEAIDLVSLAHLAISCGHADRSQFRKSYEDLLARIRKAGAIKEKEEAKEMMDGWKQWLGGDGGCNLKNAHKYSRLPQPWTPTTMEGEGGVISACPAAVLEGYRVKYSTRWESVEHPRRLEWPDRVALPRLTKEQINEAGNTFPWKTAATYDGFHPRHVTLLSDQGRETFAVICECMELLGSLPSQLGLVTMPLIPKASSGHRAIGMLTALFRVWARARRPWADEWEDLHRRSYWSADRGNSPLDTIWRQECRQEAGVADGKQAATLLYDMSNFYEAVDRDLLLQRARRTGFPEAIIRVCLAVYAGPRMLQLDGALSVEAHPIKGMIAGDTMATTLVKVYCVGAFDDMCASLPPTVKLDAHIDDLVLAAQGSPQELIQDVPKAEQLLADVIEKELRCKIAVDKAGLVTTDRRLAEHLRERIPILSGPIRTSMPNLGTDCRAAKPRGPLRKGTKRHARLDMGWKRRGRLKKLANILGKGAKTIFAVGIAPAVVYGAAAQGLTDLEARRLRRLAAAATPPRTRLRSLTSALLIADVPTAMAEVAPVLQLSRMVWKAMVQPEHARLRGSTLADIRKWHESAAPAFAPLAQKVKEVADRAGPLCEPQVNRAWRSTRGPMGAAALSLARIGWSWDTAFELIDDRGVRIQLTANTPAAVAGLLRDGHRRALERYAGAIRAKSDQGYSRGRRACTDLVEQLVKGKCPHAATPLQRGILRAAATNSIMTNARARTAGYDVEDRCPLCGAPGDNVHHRIYSCPYSVEVLERELPRWFVEEARSDGGKNSFYCSGVFPHPADLWPLPAQEQNVVAFEGRGLGAGDVYDDEGLGARTGSVFIDGTCTSSPVRGIARAACSAVEVDQHGTPIREVQMLIPATIRQTAQAAEHGGLLLGIGQLVAPTDLFTDCLGVQKTFQGDFMRAVDAKKVHGATLLQMNANPSKRSWVRSLQWVKAHRGIGTAADKDDEWRIKGNAEADLSAKRAVMAHPQPSQEAVAELEFYLLRFPLVAKAIMLSLANFPPAPGNMTRRPPPRSREEAVGRQCHYWEWDEDRWRCLHCWAWCCRRRLPKYRRYQKCEGNRDAGEAMRYIHKGHRIRAALASPPFLFCTRCGGASLRRSYKLKRRCEGPNASGRQALIRISKGLHPWQKKDTATGKEIRRTRLEGQRIFDEATGNWFDMDHGAPTIHLTGREIGKNSKGIITKGKQRLRTSKPAGNSLGLLAAACDTGTDQRDQVGDDVGNCDSQVFAADDQMGQEVEHEDHDVFGHGGALDQEDDGNGTRPDSPGTGRADGQDTKAAAIGMTSGSDQTEHGRGARCTVIRDVGTDAPIRDRGWVWADPGAAKVRHEREDGEQEVLCDMRRVLMATRSGKYSAAVEGIGLRIVFTGQEEVDKFLQAWDETRIRCNTCEGDLRTGSAKPRVGCGHPVCPGCRASSAQAQGEGWTRCTACTPGGGLNDRGPNETTNMRLECAQSGAQGVRRQHAADAAGEDWADRSRKARVRMDELRRRVLARGVGASADGRQEQAAVGPVVVQPAPATPRIEPMPDEDEEDRNREEAIGCGCRGHIHDVCARRVRRRIDGAAITHTMVQLGSVDTSGDGEGSASTTPPMACQRSTPPGHPRVALGYTSHHLCHHRRRDLREGAHERERNEGDKFCAEYTNLVYRSCSIVHGDADGDRGSPNRDRDVESQLDTDVNRLDGEPHHNRTGKGDGQQEETDEGSGTGGQLICESTNDMYRNSTNADAHHHLLHPPPPPCPPTAHRELRQHAGLRAQRHPNPRLRLRRDYWRPDSSCRGYSPKARPPPTTDAWEGEVAKLAGRAPIGVRSQTALARRQLDFQAHARHATPNCEVPETWPEPRVAPCDSEGCHGQARDGGAMLPENESAVQPAGETAVTRGAADNRPGEGALLPGLVGPPPQLPPHEAQPHDQRALFGHEGGGLRLPGGDHQGHRAIHADPGEGARPRHHLHQAVRIDIIDMYGGCRQKRTRVEDDGIDQEGHTHRERCSQRPRRQPGGGTQERDHHHHLPPLRVPSPPHQRHYRSHERDGGRIHHCQPFGPPQEIAGENKGTQEEKRYDTRGAAPLTRAQLIQQLGSHRSSGQPAPAAQRHRSDEHHHRHLDHEHHDDGRRPFPRLQGHDLLRHQGHKGEEPSQGLHADHLRLHDRRRSPSENMQRPRTPLRGDVRRPSLGQIQHPRNRAELIASLKPPSTVDYQHLAHGAHEGDQRRQRMHLAARLIERRRNDRPRELAPNELKSDADYGGGQTSTDDFERNDSTPPGVKEEGESRPRAREEETRRPPKRGELSGPPPHRKRRRPRLATPQDEPE